MPSCKNGHGSYSGTEPSPKGRGYCAKHEKVGTRKLGRDKKMWIVRKTKTCKRWFKLKKPAKKLKTKTTKKTKKLKGGDHFPWHINWNDLSDYDLLKDLHQKLVVPVKQVINHATHAQKIQIMNSILSSGVFNRITQELNHMWNQIRASPNSRMGKILRDKVHQYHVELGTLDNMYSGPANDLSRVVFLADYIQHYPRRSHADFVTAYADYHALFEDDSDSD